MSEFERYDDELRDRTDVEDLLRGKLLVSAETRPIETMSFEPALAVSVPIFLKALDSLESDEQDLLLAYFFIGKNQTSLGTIYGTAQHAISRRILDALTRVGMVLRGKDPYPRPRVPAPLKSPEDRRDPPELGEFRIDLSSPGFAALFNPRSTGLDKGPSLVEERITRPGVRISKSRRKKIDNEE